MNSTAWDIMLADLPLAAPGDIVSGLVPTLARDVQVVKLFRARNATQHDRANALVSYAFTVSRQHTDYAAAENYLLDLPRQVAAAFGTFNMRGVTGAASVQLVRAYAAFAAEPQRGLRTTVRYTVTGALPPT